MAVILNNAKATNNNVNANELPKSEFWLNIGIEVNGKFVSLNKGGVPLDRLEELKVNPKSDNKDWVAQTMLHNNIIASLKQGAESMDWGEHKRLTLEVELVKINNPAQEAEVDVEIPNPTDLIAALFKPTK